MKAARFATFGNPRDVLQTVDVEPLRPAPGEALVEVLAAPIHPSDLLTVQGLYGQLPRLPATPGNEGVGRIVEVNGPSSLPPGTMVFLPLGSGTWRTHLVTRVESLEPTPLGDPLQLAMLAVNPPTAELMLREFVTLSPGDWVLQNAANSAVGRCLIVLAKRRGVRTINVVRRPELIDEIKALGADVVLVDGDDLPRRIRTETKGAPVRLSIDAVGGSAMGRLAEATAPGGTLVSYGMMSGRPGIVSPAHLVFRNVTLRGFWLVRSLMTMTAESRRALFTDLAALVADGTLHMPVDRTYPLDALQEAIVRAGEGERHGKVLLTPAA